MEKEKLDAETARLQHIGKALQEMIVSEGWDIARSRLTERILALQNAFQIEDKTADEMLVDLKSRKLASALLFDWLKDVEGTVEQTHTNLHTVKPSHIIRED